MHLPPPKLLFIFKKYLEWANLNIRFLYSYLLPQPKLIIFIYIKPSVFLFDDPTY